MGVIFVVERAFTSRSQFDNAKFLSDCKVLVSIGRDGSMFRICTMRKAQFSTSTGLIWFKTRDGSKSQLFTTPDWSLCASTPRGNQPRLPPLLAVPGSTDFCLASLPKLAPCFSCLSMFLALGQVSVVIVRASRWDDGL